MTLTIIFICLWKYLCGSTMAWFQFVHVHGFKLSATDYIKIATWPVALPLFLIGSIIVEMFE